MVLFRRSWVFPWTLQRRQYRPVLDLDAHRADVELWVEARRKSGLPTAAPPPQTGRNAGRRSGANSVVNAFPFRGTALTVRPLLLRWLSNWRTAISVAK